MDGRAFVDGISDWEVIVGKFTLSSVLTPVDKLPNFLELYSIYQHTENGRVATKIHDPQARCVWRIVGRLEGAFGLSLTPRLIHKRF
jgi:hypothetical protein